MNEDNRRRLTWGLLLIVGALGCASLRNNPALGIMPLAIAVIEGLIYVFMLCGVRLSDWRIAAVNALIVPVYLWSLRFLDGYMIPVDMAVQLTMVLCMRAVLGLKLKYLPAVLLLFVPPFLVMLLGGTVALWIVKEESLIRAFLLAWNTRIYSYLSLAAAVLVCAPVQKRKARS